MVCKKCVGDWENLKMSEKGQFCVGSFGGYGCCSSNCGSGHTQGDCQPYVSLYQCPKCKRIWIEVQ